MGDGKRKSPESDGSGGTVAASPCKSKPSEVMGRPEDPNQMGIVIGDGEAGRADADQRMEDGRDPSRTAITGGDAAKGRNRSVFLVAGHSNLSISKPYIVYKLDAASSPSPVIRERGLRLKRGTRLKCSAGGRIFTSVRSTHRAWIVGVGGTTGDTVIFDTETRKVICGPDLKSPKSCPVLTAVGDKVYALARYPSWKRKSGPNFPPWFEVLDLEGAKVVTHEGDNHLEGCSWKSLSIPPCLPWKMSPLEYTMLPVTVVRSYVVVNSYILVSFNQPWGTHAFDTNLDKWHKVDNKELPFVGCADLLGGSIFLGLSDQHGGRINAYCINVTTSDEDHALKLSITVLQVKYEGQELDVEPCFSSLENGCFCSLENGCFCLPSFSLDTSIMIVQPEHGDYFPRKACVNLRTYQIENRSLLEASEEMLRTMKPVIVFSSQWEQTFTVSSVHHGFSQAFTFLSI